MRIAALTAFLALGLLIGCKTNRTVQPIAVTPKTVVGAYYRGDRLFYHVHLHIRADGSYEVTATSDMGFVATRAKGNWRLEGSQLTLSPREETGMRWIFPMARFEAAIHSGSVLLIPDDREWYDKSGPSTHSCFQRVEAINAPAEIIADKEPQK